VNARRPLAIMVSVSVLSGTVIAALATAQVAASPDPESGPAAAESSIAAVRRGMTVQISGQVSRVIDRDEFRVSDGTGSIPVRIAWTAASPVAVGDSVQVEGVVVDEKTFGLSRPELIARSIRLPGGATVRFDTPASAPSTPPADARDAKTSPIGALSRGQAATIAGRVTGILDEDEFRMEDASGSVRVYVGWRNRVGVRVGDMVTVVGMLDDDPWPIPAEFYAETVTLPDGRVETLRGETAGAPSGDPGAAPQTAPTVPSRISDIRPYDTVLLRGTVERITDDDEFRLRDDSASIGVYIGWRNAMPVAVGDEISVLGIVDARGPAGLGREVYAHEVTTGDGRRIELQPRREASRSPAATAPSSGAQAPQVAEAAITPIRDVRRGQAVTLQGEVRRLRDSDEFVLRDDTGTITIYIGWRNRMPVSVGQRVTVVGTADDDALPGLRPEIYAARIVLPDGRTVELIRGGRDE
jgi:uncharacterized protein YdeI (BOF family)